MNEIHDAEIGRLLSQASVAPHQEGYWDSLRQAVAPEIGRLARPPLRRRLTLRIVLVAAVAAAAAILTFAVLPALRSPSSASAATATDMLASMNDASSGGASVVRLSISRGLMRHGAWSPVAEGEPAVSRAQLTLSTSGDSRYTSSSSDETSGDGTMRSSTILTYDEQRHELRQLDTVVPNVGGDVLVVQHPSWGSSLFEVYSFENFTALAGCLRARLAEGDPDAPVTETTYLGRPAWHADLQERLPGTKGNPEGRLASWKVTVDKATGLLMKSDFTVLADSGARDEVTQSFRVTRIEVDPELPAGWDSVPTAGQEDIGIYDDGTRFGTPESVARRSSPTPVLVPAWVPGGYRLTDVATTGFEGMERSPKDKNKLIYLSRHHPHKYWWKMTSVDATVRRVVLRFRRGFSTFVVEIRPLEEDGKSAGVRPTRLSAEAVGLTSGYLAGRRARTSIAPHLGQGPTLVTRRAGYQITITGDLTRQELIDVANSLEVCGN